MASFNFELCNTGNASKYRIQRMDYLLSDHLWSSTTNHLWTDFEFITATDMKRFSVHKFILAARSPVLAALFSNNIESPSGLIESIDSKAMEQFLKFLYTGQLDGEISSSDLGHLASKYRLSTLQQLCESASLPSSIDDSGANIYDEVHEELTRSEADITSPSNLEAVSTFSWDLKLPFKRKKIANYSKSYFSCNGATMFQAEAHLLREDNYPLYMYDVILNFVSFKHHDEMDFVIEEVAYSIGYSRDEKSEEFGKLRKVTSSHLLDRFSGNIWIRKFEKTCCITFKVHLKSTIPNFGFKSIDACWGQQLWDAAVNNSMIDFVFLIGKKSIGAHRFILSARSPVFTAMLDIGMTESRSGKVRLVDVHPSTFRHFLQFVYTGMIPPKAMNKEEMFRLADKYGVETLMAINTFQQKVREEKNKTGSAFLKPFSTCSIF